MVLPKINGPEAYARMIAERPDVPVIIATGYSPDIALLQKVQELGPAVLRRPPRTQAHDRARLNQSLQMDNRKNQERLLR